MFFGHPGLNFISKMIVLVPFSYMYDYSSILNSIKIPTMCILIHLYVVSDLWFLIKDILTDFTTLYWFLQIDVERERFFFQCQRKYFPRTQ